MSEKYLIKKKDYDTTKEIVNTEYRKDDVIYPAQIGKWLKSDKMYACNILLSLEKEKKVKRIYQVKCGYCENEKPHNYDKVNDIPKTLVCSICGKEYTSMDECVLAFRKTAVAE